MKMEDTVSDAQLLLYNRVEVLARMLKQPPARVLRRVSVTHRTTGEVIIIEDLLRKYEADPSLTRQDLIAFAGLITGPVTNAAKIARALPTFGFPEHEYEHTYSTAVGIPHAMSFLELYRHSKYSVFKWRTEWIVIPLIQGVPDYSILNALLSIDLDLIPLIHRVADASGVSYARAALESSLHDPITRTWKIHVPSALFLEQLKESYQPRRELCHLLWTLYALVPDMYVTAGQIVERAECEPVPSVLAGIKAERLGRLLSTAFRLQADASYSLSSQFVLIRKRGGNSWRWAVKPS